MSTQSFPNQISQLRNNQLRNFCMQVHNIPRVTVASHRTMKVSKSKPEIKWLPKRRRLEASWIRNAVLMREGIGCGRASIARIIVHGSGSQRNIVQVR